ncbi:hypothetical protein HFN60_30280 [Rhizobium leguminosarum]|uniref:hypothetical protein n=1 Tax=Rhizobium leguminosarum TaxID=384 RepID=UPI001C96FF69|nr:hypothetical protein [Rhizobium leguminosarum]MBY5819882.1 hypothetical protein [Rhizobium leguminosarum]
MSIKAHLDREFFVCERKRLQLTQPQIAAILFQSLDTIKKWEGGSRRIPPFVVYAFAALDAGIEPRGKDRILHTQTGGDAA